VTVFHRLTPVRAACVLSLVGLSACSSFENFVGGDKIDYRSASTTRVQGLEVPPDLSQLGRDQRYVQPSGGSVSAAQFQAGAAATGTAAAAPAVAPAAVGDFRIERAGNDRWLVTSLTPEQLWPQLEAFWKERGFVLVVDQADAGVMETDWAENRAKLPQDVIRATLGRIAEQLYSTGERDKFRTRVERTPKGTEVYISHKGLEEIYSGDRKETTVWQPRKPDPLLEGEMLQRLMVKLGQKEEQAKTMAAAATAPTPEAPRARMVQGQPATLQVDDNFDRAWRRVGVALDRSGFTVEDRDRAQGIYFVRYVDPKSAGKEQPGFFSRLFSFGKKQDASGPAKYRVSVKGEGERSTVTVLNSSGAPESGDAGKQIASLLVEDLK
jgi:outer membrane protein assembly factor BamC